MHDTFVTLSSRLQEQGYQEPVYAEQEDADEGCEMTFQWTTNNVHFLLTARAHSGEVCFTVTHDGHTIHRHIFDDPADFTADYKHVLRAVDNAALLVATHTVLREMEAVLREQGLHPVLLTDRYGDEKSLSWISWEGAYTSLSFWTDDNRGMFSSHSKGELLFRQDFQSIEELRAGYMEALEAMNLAGRISRGKQVLDNIKAYLGERGIEGRGYYMSDDEEMNICWYDGETRNSLNIWADDGDAYMSSCCAGKITFGHTFDSIAELAGGYREVLEAAHLIALA